MKRLIPLIMLVSGSALAIDDNEVIQKLSPAWATLEQKAVALVGPDYQKQMVDAAFASVAVSACPGLAYNAEEVDKRFSKLVAEKGGKTPEEQQTFTIKASTLYGAYLGLLIAESHLDTPTFCKYVDKAKAGKEGPKVFWTQK
ncbi:MAG: hypothetical protein RLZZ627_1560 [Pseudomonadota bacterium]|jgi:hypothetical protein